MKPVLMATSIQRPPVLKGHSVMSQRCPRNIQYFAKKALHFARKASRVVLEKP